MMDLEYVLKAALTALVAAAGGGLWWQAHVNYRFEVTQIQARKTREVSRTLEQMATVTSELLPALRQPTAGDAHPLPVTVQATRTDEIERAGRMTLRLVHELQAAHRLIDQQAARIAELESGTPPEPQATRPHQPLRWRFDDIDELLADLTEPPPDH